MTRQEIPVFKTREENVAYMNETLPIQESFDLIQRDLLIGGRVSSFYFVNGFTSEETMLKIMDALLKVKEEEMPEDVWEFANACIPYVEVEVLFDFDQILKSLLSGETCVFIDGYRACIVIDCRTYPVRSVEEPDKDKSLRGSRDGFVETLVYNTAMMRRRIRHFRLFCRAAESTVPYLFHFIIYRNSIFHEDSLHKSRSCRNFHCFPFICIIGDLCENMPLII